MKLLLLFAAGFMPAFSFAQETLTLSQVVANTDRVGFYALDQGYRGKFTKRFEMAGIPVENETFEFTHASFPNSEHPDIADEDLPINEIVVGQQQPASTGEVRYSSPAVAVDRLPSFEDLTKLREISDYERIFGKSRIPTDAWGMNGEWHSTRSWMGFTRLDGRGIRVISVFLQTVDKGDGWKISTRHICEGVFQPTGNPPVLEKAEQ